MKMVDVAFAAGFGSLRRFNEAFRRLYGSPPSALRREPRERAVRGTRHHAHARLRRALRLARHARLLRGTRDPRRRMRRARSLPAQHRRERLPGQHRGARRSRAATRSRRRSDSPISRSLPAIIGRIRSTFDLGGEVAAIDAQLAEDPVLAARVRGATRTARAGRVGSLRTRGARRARPADHRDGRAERWLRSWSRRTANRSLPVRTRASASCSRAPSGSPLPTSHSRCRARGSPRSAESRRPPSPIRDSSMAAAISTRRSRGCARCPASANGPRTTSRMRALREPDAFPAADIGLLRAMTGRDGLRPTPAALLARAERWRPWRAYAAQHLWSGDSGTEAETPNRRGAAA